MSIPWTILLSSLQTGLTPHHSSDSVSPKAISQKWTDTVLDTINFVFSLSIRLPWGHFFWFLHTSLGLVFSSLQGNHFFCLYLRYRGPLRCHSQSSALLLPLPRRFLLLSSFQLYFKYVNDNQIFVAESRLLPWVPKFTMSDCPRKSSPECWHIFYPQFI